MPFEKGAGPAEEVEDFLLIHAAQVYRRLFPTPAVASAFPSQFVALPFLARSVVSNSFRMRLYSSAQLVCSVKPCFSTG